MNPALLNNNKLNKTRKGGLKIGILSDTHDNLVKLEKAVIFFNKNRVGFVFHAGDFVAPFTIAKLNELSCEWAGVFGNNDGEREGLSRISEGKISFTISVAAGKYIPVKSGSSR